MNSFSFFLVLVTVAFCVSAKKVHVYSPDDVPLPQNLCNFQANDNDMNNAGVTEPIADWCTNHFGKRPDAVHVNADGEPYKMCLANAPASFGNLTPFTGQAVVAKDSFNNTSNQTVTHKFDLEGSFKESIEVSTTTTVSVSVSVDYSVTIPEIFSTIGFSIDTSFSTSRTDTHSAEHSLSWAPSETVDCQPHCLYLVQTSVQTQIYKADMYVPICLTGYARCQFGDRVQGHYFWYILVDDVLDQSKRCYTQRGTLSSIVSDVNAQTTFSKQC